MSFVPGHEIVIEISPEGEIKGKVEGVSGSACSNLSAWLDKLGKVEVDSQTPDYYKPNNQGVQTWG